MKVKQYSHHSEVLLLPARKPAKPHPVYYSRQMFFSTCTQNDSVLTLVTSCMGTAKKKKTGDLIGSPFAYFLKNKNSKVYILGKFVACVFSQLSTRKSLHVCLYLACVSAPQLSTHRTASCISARCVYQNVCPREEREGYSAKSTT